MEGQKKEQNERTHVQAKKLGVLIRAVKKSHVFNPPPPRAPPTCHKKDVKKRKGKDFIKNI